MLVKKFASTLWFWREELETYPSALDYMIDVNQGKKSARKNHIVFTICTIIFIIRLAIYQLSLYCQNPSLIQYDFTAQIFQKKQYDIKFAFIIQLFMSVLIFSNYRFFRENLLSWYKTTAIIAECANVFENYRIKQKLSLLVKEIKDMHQEKKNNFLQPIDVYPDSYVKTFTRMRPMMFRTFIRIGFLVYYVVYFLLRK